VKQHSRENETDSSNGISRKQTEQPYQGLNYTQVFQYEKLKRYLVDAEVRVGKEKMEVLSDVSSMFGDFFTQKRQHCHQYVIADCQRRVGRWNN